MTNTAPVPAELAIARHGQAWCNLEQTIAGPATCRGLTNVGRHQIRRLAGRLRHEHHTVRPVDALYASPLPRTRQSAELIAAELALPYTVVDELREPDYGSADGARWADAVAAFGAAPALHPDQPITAGAEPWLDHLARVITALGAILTRHPGQRVLLVAHGETVTAAHHLFLAVPTTTMLPLAFTVDQASLTIWRQQPVSWLRPEAGLRWALDRHNDTAHLAADDELTNVE